MSDLYAKYQRLKFDRPHPRVLRIKLSSLDGEATWLTPMLSRD